MTGKQPSRRPNFDEVKAHLETFSREPFQEVLAEVIAAKPDARTLEGWAAEYPDKWGHLMKVMAGLTGYRDTSSVEHNVLVEVRSLGDAELLDRLDKLRETVGVEKGKEGKGNQQIIDVTPDTSRAPASAGDAEK